MDKVSGNNRFDMVIHHTQERILKQIYERRLEEFEMRMEYLNIELRMEMSKLDRGATKWPSREAVFEQPRAGCSEVCLCFCVCEQTRAGCNEMASQRGWF